MSDPIDIVARLSGMSADHGPDGWPAVQMRDITALCEEVTRLRAALAQAGAGREPVAWLCEWINPDAAPITWSQYRDASDPMPDQWVDPPQKVTPLYAHPSPAQREPLTDAQLAQGLRAAIDIPTAHEAAAFRKGARWAWGVKLADSGATSGTKGAA